MERRSTMRIPLKDQKLTSIATQYPSERELEV